MMLSFLKNQLVTVKKLLTLSPMTTSGMQLSGYIPGSAASKFTKCQRVVETFQSQWEYFIEVGDYGREAVETIVLWM